MMSKKQPDGTMKIATLAVYGLALGLVCVGLRELLTGFEENRCSMTYMFEYPEYRVRSRQANINTDTYIFTRLASKGPSGLFWCQSCIFYYFHSYGAFKPAC